MTGHRSGVVKKIKNVDTDIIFTHCILHREQLAAKRLSPELHEVLSDVIKIINEIRHKALNSRLFESLCDEMGSQHKHLLLHAEVRWLSRGKVLTRLFNMRQEVKLFFQQQNNSKFQNFFSDDDWVAKLAYLADIFSLLNELNISIQGQLSDVFTLRSKMDAFQKKILLWKTLLIDEDLQMFPNLDEYMKEKDVNRQIIGLVQQHLQSLKESFEHYYPKEEDPRNGNMWIVNPFSSNIEESNLNVKEKESLIELSSDDSLKLQFNSSSRSHFWLSVKSEYPILSEKALKIVTPFTTTYLCEKTFSTVTAIKNKYRSRLEIEAPLRVAVTSLEPRISKIILNQEQQMSH